MAITRIMGNTFGQSVFDPVGQFRFLNCEIWAGSKSLRGLLEDVNREDATLVMDWRRAVQAYYLNDQAFRDGYLTDLPDIATVSLDVDTWSPAWFAGGGFGGKLAYTVDRYGRAYFSIGGTASFGGGVPLNVVYSEGYVHRWQGGNHIASPGELETLIPGWDFGVGGTFLWWHAGAEVNLDSSIFSYLTGAFGFSPIPRIEIGAEGSYTWKFRHSVNPAGWYWIETIRCYEEKDIPRR